MKELLFRWILAGTLTLAGGCLLIVSMIGVMI